MNTLQRYISLKISDGQRRYPYLYDGQYLYCPDYNPTKYGKYPDLCLSVGGSSFVISQSDFMACGPFRHEGYNYQQAYKITDSNMFGYVSLIPWKNGAADPNYVGVQSAWLEAGPELYTNIEIGDKDVPLKLMWDPKFGTNLQNLIEGVSKYYVTDPDNIETSGEVVVMDDENLYWHNDTMVTDGDVSGFKLINWPYTNHFQYKDDLKIASILHFTLKNDDNILHIDIRSNPFPISPERYARFLHLAGGGNKTIESSKIKDMNVIKPRIMNKTINQVVEMTSQTDSKSNIIQPIFFRSREMASIIIHPAVTENIGINLDAYKAQVDRFYIKIEGISFPEIGRTESGVIFKIKGSMLAGKLTAGTYYILNQDADLVTTGKYMYES